MQISFSTEGAVDFIKKFGPTMKSFNGMEIDENVAKVSNRYYWNDLNYFNKVVCFRPKLSEEEKLWVEQLLQIFHDAGLTAKEADLLARSLEKIENFEILLRRLEKLPKVDKETVYLQVISVSRGIDIPGLFIP